jgi:shikimate 5-dehydrogenase
MLVHQAAAALELWTGSAAPLEAIRSAVDRHLAGG